MPINKTFKNPTVKNVIFQIKYSNLFSIERLIPDIQLAIISKFPESSLVINQTINIAISNEKNKPEIIENDQQNAQKIWKFECKDGYSLEISNNSLSISSNLHKHIIIKIAKISLEI